MVIVYDYDPLNRLTAADYSDGSYFHYLYDPVGNRQVMTTTGEIVTNYLYDEANRLANVGGVSYTWDNNGNLLGDGVNTYTYDHAHRLVSVTDGIDSFSFAYNGLGDRYQQTANSITTTYDLDISGGLTQVLADGTNTYLYGVNRLTQQHEGVNEYFLGDALGSMRQLATNSGKIILTNAYKPYGEVLDSVGEGASAYGYTGEWMDETGLVYLRARYYAPRVNQFIQADTIAPDYRTPQSLNAFSYVRNTPTLFTDPSGLSPNQFTHNDRDLTWWLYKELSTNVNSYYVRRIKSLLGGPLIDKENAIAGWIYLVKDKAKWDFKHKIDLEIGRAITFFDNDQGFRWYEYSVPGNIFYGYIGSAAGFNSAALHAGASYAEIRDPAHVERDEACCPCPPMDNQIVQNCRKYLCLYINPRWAPTGFDDPNDYHAVQLGVDLFKFYRDNLTFSQLINSITTNGDKLAHPASPPSSFEWTNPRGGWPYSPGRFNGPDELLNESKVLEYLIR
jgi:RHS repeat-associated protein